MTDTPSLLSVPCDDSVALKAERRRDALFGAFTLAREIGDTKAVSNHLRRLDVLDQGGLSSEAASAISEAREWLAAALDHERLHGFGSAADQSHPFWAELQLVRAIVERHGAARRAPSIVAVPGQS